MKKRILFAIALILLPLIAQSATRRGNVLYDESYAVPIPEVVGTPSTEAGQGKFYKRGWRPYFSDDSGNERILTTMAENAVQVWSMADFPAAVGGVITLPLGNSKYIINTSILTTDRFIIPTGSNVEFTTGFDGNVSLTYVGSGNFFSSTEPGTIVFRQIDFYNNGTGTLFSISGSPADTIIIMDYNTLAGWASLGTISEGNLFSVFKCFFVQNGDGFYVSDFFVSQITHGEFKNTVDSSNVFLTFNGDTLTDVVDISEVIAYTLPNESFIEINPAIKSTSAINIKSNSNRGNGKFFSISSLNEKDVRMDVKGNPGQKDSASKGSFHANNNVTPTTITVQNDWYDLNLNGLATPSSNIERWSLINTTTGELRYVGRGVFSGTLFAGMSAYSAGATEIFEVRAVVNGLPTSDGIIMSRSLAAAIGTLPLPVPIQVNPNDTVRLQVRNTSGTSDIVVKYIAVGIQ